MLLRSDRGAGSAFAAGQTRRRGRRTRAPRRFDHLQLRGAQVRCPLSDADVHGAATLPELDCAADAVRCLPARSGDHPRNSLQFTSIIEPLSLDEAYLDVSAHATAPAALAQEIRSAIFRTTKLTSSAGIGPNKLIAKIASEINKPNGQFEVRPEQVADFMKDLPVRKIWGIGEKSERKLEELGVKTCGELQRFSRPELVNVFGKFGLELYELCRGIDDRPVEPDRPRKSLSTEETFAVDLATLEQCEEKLEELFQDVMADLAQKESSRAITKIFVKLKFNDFTRTTAERTGVAPTLEGFRSLLEEAFGRTGKPVRLIGVGVRFAEPMPEDTQMDLL